MSVSTYEQRQEEDERTMAARIARIVARAREQGTLGQAVGKMTNDGTVVQCESRLDAHHTLQQAITERITRSMSTKSEKPERVKSTSGEKRYAAFYTHAIKLLTTTGRKWRSAIEWYRAAVDSFDAGSGPVPTPWALRLAAKRRGVKTPRRSDYRAPKKHQAFYEHAFGLLLAANSYSSITDWHRAAAQSFDGPASHQTALVRAARAAGIELPGATNTQQSADSAPAAHDGGRPITHPQIPPTPPANGAESAAPQVEERAESEDGAAGYELAEQVARSFDMCECCGEYPADGYDNLCVACRLDAVEERAESEDGAAGYELAMAAIGGEVPAELINHPPHYNSHPSGVECITITEHHNFCIGNAIKYLWRADHKGAAIEDLKKAAWYINREISRLERLAAGNCTSN